MQADGGKQDSERCFAAAMRCCEDPLLVCALQTAGENDNSEIGYLNEEQRPCHCSRGCFANRF